MHLVRLTEPGRGWLHGIWPLVLLLCACAFPCRETRADECSLAPHAGLQSVSVHTPSGDRPVAVYFPPNYVEARPLALVIDLHGSGGNGEEHAAVSGLRPLAERRHFIVASPDGGVSLPGQPGAHAWNVPGVPLVGDARLPADAPDDVAFLAGLIDTLTAAHCADAHHVYVTGFSGGARMASALACSLPERIAAIAPVAGLRAGRARPDDPASIDTASCAPAKPVAVLAFHGTDDPTNAYDGSHTLYWGYSVPKALARWAEIDGCNPTPVIQPFAAHIQRISYLYCRPGMEVTFYLTDAPRTAGGGHVWPKAEGPNPLDASALMLDFFAQHKRR